jgi:hypothetical protein
MTQSVVATTANATLVRSLRGQPRDEGPALFLPRSCKTGAQRRSISSTARLLSVMRCEPQIVVAVGNQWPAATVTSAARYTPMCCDGACLPRAHAASIGSVQQERKMNRSGQRGS